MSFRVLKSRSIEFNNFRAKNTTIQNLYRVGGLQQGDGVYSTNQELGDPPALTY